MELLRDGPQAALSVSTAVTTSSSSSWKRPVLPEASQAPPDVMLHVGGCVFALHEEVLRLRWPLYHQLLQTTLFYCAPGNVSSDVGDILTVSEMQQLPVETLALVLCSDRLCIPEGERTLLRCLNKMVFGLDVYNVGADAQLPRPYFGRVDDVTRLYRCVRWCFVPLDDIIPTLRWTPRTLKLYEIIVESLRDPNRSHKRRRPFGWRKFRDAYMTNETNLSEFEIEAGDLNLAPSGAASLTMLNSVLR
ncbi:hypothetical protein JG688_00015786 [Phytophthora aleatoria]|uniref:BTB domain-containing protein n=1 Tax=Phytophthora aleatoria TaxID=2496075 RepID=A0A8J5LWL9_9STRA|nr:hypothetical protein JG688_00015786 [Phytophthora aleatoria]